MFVKRIALLIALNVLGGAAWSAARAADLPLKAPAIPYDWTGFYLGGNLGAAIGTSLIFGHDSAGAKHVLLKQPRLFYRRRSARHKVRIPQRSCCRRGSDVRLACEFADDVHSL